MRVDKIQNVKRADLTKLHSKKIVLDRDVSTFLSDFFGLERNSKSLQLTEDSSSYTLNTVRGNKPLTYNFDKNKLKEVLNDEAVGLSLSQTSSKVWLAMILILYETYFDDREKLNNPHALLNEKYRSGCFTSSQMRKLLNLPKGGKQNQIIRQAFASLTAASLSVKSSQVSGKLHIDTQQGFNFINQFKIVETKEEGGDIGETTYYFTLNRQALGISLDWIINNRLSVNQIKRGYLSVPVSDLKKKQSLYYSNFLTRLRLYGGHKPVTAKLVLTEWMKVSESKLKNKTWCKTQLNEYFTQAKKDHEIISFQTDFTTNNQNWLDSWTISIEK